jgi:phosphoribosylcarboxyaminoimidazole (NCAIR) mutase
VAKCAVRAASIAAGAADAAAVVSARLLAWKREILEMRVECFEINHSNFSAKWSYAQ